VRGVSRTAGIISPNAKPSDDVAKYLVVEAGDCAYNPYRVNIGSIALFHERAIVSPSYVVFAARPDIAMSEFIYRFLRSDEGLRQIDMHARGSVRKALPASALKSIEVALPTLTQQRRICDIARAITGDQTSANLPRVRGGIARCCSH
jgi:type I restriction enzyme S subunit